MKVRWEFYKSETENGNMIAAMLDEDGKHILIVYESDNVYHAIFCKDYSMFKNFDITHEEVYRYIDTAYNDNCDYKHIHVKAFEYASTKIELKFYHQLLERYKNS